MAFLKTILFSIQVLICIVIGKEDNDKSAEQSGNIPVPNPCDCGTPFPPTIPITPIGSPLMPNGGQLDLPGLNILTTTDQVATKYILDGCEIMVSKDICKIYFVPSVDTCNGKVPLQTVLKHFYPTLKLQTISLALIQPGIYDVKKFDVDKCTNLVRFNATAKEPVEIIPNKLKIVNAQLDVKLSSKATEFTYDDLDFTMTGSLLITTIFVNVVVTKKKTESLISYKLNIQALPMSDFVALFTNLDFKSGSAFIDATNEPQGTPEKLRLLTATKFLSPIIIGIRSKDGFYEFITTGTVFDPLVNKTVKGILVIQKNSDSKVAVALILKYIMEKPSLVLSSITGGDIGDIPMLGDAAANFTLQLATSDIGLAKHSRLKDVFKDYSSGGDFLCKGMKIKGEIPIVTIILSRNRSANASGMPDYVKVEIIMRTNGLKFKLPDRMKINLQLLLTLLSSAKVHKIPKKQILFTKDPPLMNVNGFDVSTTEHSISITAFAVGNVYYGNGIASLANPQFTLIRPGLKVPWKIAASGKVKLAIGYLEQSVERRKGFGYIFSAKAMSIRVREITKIFRAIFVAEEVFKKGKYWDFIVRDFLIKGKVGPKMRLRFAGKPDFFGWKNVKCEGLIFRVGSKTIMVMGMVIENMKLTDFVWKLFGKKLIHADWIPRLTIGITISSYTFEAVRKVPSFHTTLLKEYPMKEGIQVATKVQMPSDCKEDTVCEEIKSLIRDTSSFDLKGKIENGELHLSAKYIGYLKLGHQLDLQELQMTVTVAEITKLGFNIVAKLKNQDLTLQGRIGYGLTGKTELRLLMDKPWKMPFGISYLYFSNLDFQTSIQPNVPLQTIAFQGQFNIDAREKKRSIKAPVTIIMDITSPMQDYFYAQIKEFDLITLTQAFDMNITLPKILREAVFPNGAIASFTFEPAGKMVYHLDFKVGAGFRISGKVNTTGQMVPCEISINFPNEVLIEILFPPLPIANGLIKLFKSRSDIENGPKLVAKLTKQMVEITLIGYTTTLGIASDVSIILGKDGIHFFTFGQLFNIFPTNVSMVANKNQNIETAEFQVSGCLPSALQEVTSITVEKLTLAADESKEELEKAKVKVSKFTKIYDTAKQKYLTLQQKSDDQENNIQKRCDKIMEIKKELRDNCVDRCGKVCVGGPKWVKQCTPILGQWISCCKWDKCKHKVPDTTCIARCKGNQIIKGGSLENKQAGIDILLGVLRSIKLSLIFTKSFMNKCKTLLSYATKGIESLRNAVDIGANINEAVANYTREGILNLNQMCYKTTLERATTSCLPFNIKGVYHKTKKLQFTCSSCVDGGFSETIAKRIMERMYPGMKGFKKELDASKAIFEDLNVRKNELEKDIEEEEKFSSHDEYQKKTSIPSDKMRYFREVAYGDVPQVLLQDEDTISAFSKKAVWTVIKDDPSFDDGFRELQRDQIPSTNNTVAVNIGNSTANKTFGEWRLRNGTDKQNCSNANSHLMHMIGRSLKDLLDSIREQKKYYSKSEVESYNKFNDVEKQLKNECAKNNCTSETLERAMQLLADARNGTADWLTKLWVQIEDADEKSLATWDKQLASLLSSNSNTRMSDFMQSDTVKRSFLSKRTKTVVWSEISAITSNILGDTDVAVTQKEDWITRLNNKLQLIADAC